jgi:serine/threonine protein kinase
MDIVGKDIERYHIVEQLGQGGMATVYKAYDTRLERDVAIKIIRNDVFSPITLERVQKRFAREGKTLAKLSTANIIKIFDYGEYEGAPYLVMEFISGGTLKQVMGKPIPWQDAFRILLPIAHALDYAHGLGVVHRDVKPANILLNMQGQPMLSDFGIAKLLEGDDGTTLTGFGVGIGTPEYMSPEQCMGGSDIDGRTDIYSMGIILYELITGKKPFVADTPMAVVFKQHNDPLPRPGEFVRNLPEAVEKILYKALVKNKEDRYASMAEFTNALENQLGLVKSAAQATRMVLPPIPPTGFNAEPLGTHVEFPPAIPPAPSSGTPPYIGNPPPPQPPQGMFGAPMQVEQKAIWPAFVLNIIGTGHFCSDTAKLRRWFYLLGTLLMIAGFTLYPIDFDNRFYGYDFIPDVIASSLGFAGFFIYLVSWVDLVLESTGTRSKILAFVLNLFGMGQIVLDGKARRGGLYFTGFLAMVIGFWFYPLDMDYKQFGYDIFPDGLGSVVGFIGLFLWIVSWIDLILETTGAKPRMEFFLLNLIGMGQIAMDGKKGRGGLYLAGFIAMVTGFCFYPLDFDYNNLGYEIISDKIGSTFGFIGLFIYLVSWIDLIVQVSKNSQGKA